MSNRAERRRAMRTERKSTKHEDPRRTEELKRGPYVSPDTPCQCRCGHGAPWRKAPADPVKQTEYYLCCTECWELWRYDRLGFHGLARRTQRRLIAGKQPGTEQPKVVIPKRQLH